MNDTTSTREQRPDPSAPVPPLVRPREGRVIAGVAAGVAARLGIGTGWVRVGFIIASFFGGLGVLLYIVGWLAIPEAGEEDSIAAARVADLEGSRWIGIALIVVGGLLVLSWTDVVRGEFVWAGALVLVGILLYRGELPSPRRPAPSEGVALPPPLPPPSEAAAADLPAEPETDAGTERAEDGKGDEEDVEPPPPPPPPPAATISKPPRSMLGRFTLAAMFVVVGTMALLDNAGVIEPSLRHYVGAVVGVTGVGLVVGAWVGRSRGLIAFGILLLPILLISSVVRVPFSGEFGERRFFPGAAVAVADEYRLGAGDLLVDLGGVDLEGSVVDFDATVGAGRLRIRVPDDAAVYVDARVGFGELVVFGTSRSGVGREYSTAPPAGATSYVNVHAEVGFGQLEVIRVQRFPLSLPTLSASRVCVGGPVFCPGVLEGRDR